MDKTNKLDLFIEFMQMSMRRNKFIFPIIVISILGSVTKKLIEGNFFGLYNPSELDLLGLIHLFLAFIPLLLITVAFLSLLRGTYKLISKSKKMKAGHN